MRERFQKNRKEINQEDQISELAFNFPRALSILTFYENGLTLFTEKNKENKSKRKTKMGRKKKKEKKEKKKNRGETREKKKKRKSFCLSAHVRKVNFK